jgi:hypothetical protein
MERDKIDGKKLLEMVEAIVPRIAESLRILQDAALMKKEAADFITGDVLLIVQTIYLANCDLASDDQAEIDQFEKDLQVRFDLLAEMNKNYSFLPGAEPRALRELAAVAIQTRDRLCLGAREEYVNRFIVSLTITADKLAKQEKLR